MALDGCTISLEFAPFTKGIRISNLPKGTTSDDMKFKFSNPKTGGGHVTDVVLNKACTVAYVYFENSSGTNHILNSLSTIRSVHCSILGDLKTRKCTGTSCQIEIHFSSQNSKFLVKYNLLRFQFLVDL